MAVKGWVKENLIWKIVERTLLLFIRARRVFIPSFVLIGALQLGEALILLVLVKEGNVVDLECYRVASIMPEKGTFGAHN